ncbi:hypothetical protein CCACVL1_30162 [Corchorus capsularis]|uniref:Uncharacterized protein n=1 Tax=Corchorus capsularis TaxID=210143 RepID=A0A1R3FYH9_COCAP|nr:hypothetical protein CCACVL1_30162 [Corchorus capsularis]
MGCKFATTKIFAVDYPALMKIRYQAAGS